MLTLDPSELNIRAVPNIDFIGTVESSGDSVEYKTYPIEVPRQFFVLLMAFARDDSKSIMQMQKLFRKHYPTASASSIDRNFLAPQNLNDTLVTPADFPTLISKDEYDAEVQNIRALVTQKNQSIEYLGTTSRFPLEVEIEKCLQQYHRSLKFRFVAQFVRFQAAYGYGQTLEKFRIKERLNREVRMFSTDTIGWTTYNYVITHDITIQLDSNFGYGRSSYFLLSLMYKGIEIYPFSAYVRYPYANMRTLIGHTRTYRVERDSWPDALMFVAETANAAIRSPQTFMETCIADEIDKMMDGLRRIIQTNVFREKTADDDEDSRPQYLGVSTKGIRSFQYVAAPEEMLLAQKAERIIGALAVLEKLKILDTVAANANKSIRELLDMVSAIVPELEGGIKNVQGEIHNCETECGFMKSVLSSALQAVDIHEKAVRKIQDDILIKQPADITKWRRDSIVANEWRKYRVDHPEFDHVCTVREKVSQEVRELQSHINVRNVFLHELMKCYGVGKKGERFWFVIENLYPHEVEIESEVRRRVSELSAKTLFEGLMVFENPCG